VAGAAVVPIGAASTPAPMVSGVDTIGGVTAVLVPIGIAPTPVPTLSGVDVSCRRELLSTQVRKEVYELLLARQLSMIFYFIIDLFCHKCFSVEFIP